ncbi:acetylcholine receptor subunit alpha-like 2 [Mizuhopecten yessoensis]|uniref:Acetylcholine receptor subunit alpha-like 2 n=1 Tax=Mizuhopecten yessoensis TaxID=6573 RepID=A0A210Q882_MIZYE|nr:acetylcholine receptor subunit alpha-like 2 [Mizuhopecten yessoensis]OWF44950.1 Acetylcholine receptor subunit alpha-like 2 [Mizuhopecten yessoensis]
MSPLYAKQISLKTFVMVLPLGGVVTATRTMKTLLMVLFLGSVVKATGTMKDIETLNDTLFEEYRSEFRPAFYNNDTVDVELQYYLYSVIDFNVVNEIVSLSGIMRMIWKDYRLTWDPQKYGGVEGMVLPANQVWLPTIVLMTAVDSIGHIGSEDFSVYVHYSGEIYWNPANILMSSCDANMRSFPKDQHTCVLILNNMIHTKEEMRLVASSPSVNMDFYAKNGEWDVIWTKVSDKFDKYKKIASASFISITISMARKSEYFIINMLIPVTVLCLIESLVFLIPVSASDRISFSMTLFLALAVYMAVMGEFLPTTSEPLPGMTYFLLASVIHSTVVILMTLITVRLYDREHPPDWLVHLYQLIVRKSRKSKQPRTDEDLNENLPLDSGNRESVVLVENNGMLKRSLLNAVDVFMFVISLSSMLLMCIVFYIVYLRLDKNAPH